MTTDPKVGDAYRETELSAFKPKCGKYSELKGFDVEGTLKGFGQKWRILYCTECGKELELWIPPLVPQRQAKPDWVTE